MTGNKTWTRGKISNKFSFYIIDEIKWQSNTGQSVLKSKGFYRTGGHFTGIVRHSDGISFSLGYYKEYSYHEDFELTHGSEKTFDISVKPKSRIMLKLLATFLSSWFLFAPALSEKKIEMWNTNVCRQQYRGVMIHFFHKRYVSRYLICITIRITVRFIGNCNYSLKSMLVDMGAAMFFFIWGRLRTSRNYKYLIFD